MKSRSLLVPSVIALALSLSLTACETLRGDEEEDEVSLTLAELPEPVRAAVLARTSEDNITQLTSEVEGGQTVYEVEYTTVDGDATEAEFDAAGNLLEEGDDADDEDDDDAGEDDDN